MLKTRQGLTPLLKAVMVCKKSLYDTFVSFGARVNDTDCQGKTLLMSAVEHQKLATLANFLINPLDKDWIGMLYKKDHNGGNCGGLYCV